MNRKRLGEVLRERGLISPEELERALAAGNGRGGRLGEVLAKNGAVSKQDLGAALEAVNGMPYVECPPEAVPPEVLASVPATLAARSCALPIAIEGGGLVVAMGEPQHLSVLEELEFASGMRIEPRFSFRSDVVEGIRRFYGVATARPGPPTPAVPRVEGVATAGPHTTSMDPMPSGVPRIGWAAGLILVAGSGIAALGGWQAGVLTQTAVNGVSAYISSLRTEAGTPVRTRALPTRRDTPPAGEAPLPYAVPDAGIAVRIPQSPSPVLSEDPAPPTAAEAPRPRFGSTVQVGVFRRPENAQRLAQALAPRPRVRISARTDGLYAVEVGPFDRKQTADQIAAEIQTATGLNPLVRQVRLDQVVAQGETEPF